MVAEGKIQYLINMKDDVEDGVSYFLRTYSKPFTVSDFEEFLRRIGEKASKKEIRSFLDCDDRVFPLEGHLYLTKAAAFTGMFFSFVPTQQELEQGVFVPGDRCMPFVDNEMLSCQLIFEYGGHLLDQKVFETDCNTARNLFTFFGDEYASQYIASDPVNEDLCLANNNFELPPKLKLTGISLDRVLQDVELKKGDRILCRVNDWDTGVIEIFPVVNHKKNPFVINAEKEDRKNWVKNLENALLNTFDKMGPCQSMEQQLSFAFYENRKQLCSPECASLHEFLDESEKISMELFGVETRLWRKGENVPAVGEWNKDSVGAGNSKKGNKSRPFGMPEYLLDCMIQDQFYEKKDNCDEVIRRFMCSVPELSREDQEFFTLQIMNRSAILRQRYNWFADFATGPLRHKAIELYSRVEELVFDVDGAGDQLASFPQQELVILTQLFAHISRILEMLANGSDCAEEETALKMSLEGMEYNFEDIRTRLKAAVDKYRAGQFKII